MAKYDEFDLDIRKTEESVARGPIEMSIMQSCLAGVCDTSTVTTTCPYLSCMCTATQQDDCSNTCSACHSYCGGAC